MAAINKSSRQPVATKVVILVIAVAMIGILFTSATGEEASAVPQQEKQEPQCNLWVPDCDAWCRLEGHPGGYVKGDVCCCNSGGGSSGGQLAADS